MVESKFRDTCFQCTVRGKYGWISVLFSTVCFCFFHGHGSFKPEKFQCANFQAKLPTVDSMIFFRSAQTENCGNGCEGSASCRPIKKSTATAQPASAASASHPIKNPHAQLPNRPLKPIRPPRNNSATTGPIFLQSSGLPELTNKSRTTFRCC